MERIRQITLPNGSSPYAIERTLILQGIDEASAEILYGRLNRNGQGRQGRIEKPFEIAFHGFIKRENYAGLREWLDAFDAAAGLADRRLYVNDNRYFWIRHVGTRLSFQYPGPRNILMFVEARFQVLDPYMTDADTGVKFTVRKGI